MNILKTLFASMRMALLLIALYALACAVATFVEKYYGTLSARAYIYDSFWFELLHVWLGACLIGCFLVSKAWARRRYASLLLHFSFIVIIIGAGVTRYFGFEGTMSLREGDSSNSINTSTHFVFIQVKNKQGQTQYVKIPTYIDTQVNKRIAQKLDFFDSPLDIQTGEVSTDENGLFHLDMKLHFQDEEIDTQVVRDGDNPPNKQTVTMLQAKDYLIFLAWGTDIVEIPFHLKLEKFELERYPGSHSPASYASLVQVIDEQKDSFDFKIFMNHVLDYRGFRFFQSSYFPDEKGTILSVNNDPGKLPTYIGYTLLILGIFWLLFDKGGRFASLGRFLKTQKFISLALVLAATLSLPSPLKADSTSSQNQATQDLQSSKVVLAPTINQMIESLKHTDDFAHSFDRILVQDFGGRTKPFHTLADDFIHKITQKRNFLALNPTQIFIGMLFYPEQWQSIQMIATKTPKLRQILGLPADQKYIAYIDVFTKDGQYILQNYVESANLKPPAMRDTFEKDVIALDERINAAFLIYTGQVLKIFPDEDSQNNQWFYPLEAISSAVAKRNMEQAHELMSIYKQLAESMEQGVQNSAHQSGAPFAQALEASKRIIAYQQAHGGAQVISSAKIDSEIWLNTYNPFYQLTYPYLILSIVLFIIVLSSIMRNRPTSSLTHRIFYALFVVLFIVHTLGLALRWYVSDHAPWSNAYESMLYIAWASMGSSVIFFSRSNLALCASSFMAGITLFVANLGFMDPQIGNLVPVLKSYWLNIHVSVITASYGFFGLCFVLGLITLIMFILRKESHCERTRNINNSIFTLSALNEMSMILGLFLLCAGNFLGGVWANESWGRYWGWDSKETWALISIGVYAIIVHLRFIVRINIPFVFASASVLGFFSVLMTYFGVNYYLSGMHSYAAGDAPPLPWYIKVLVVGVFVLIAVAFRKRQLDMPKISTEHS